MKILQLCSKAPFPPADGGSMAMHALTQGLLDLNVKVKVVVISTPKHPFNPASLPKEYVNLTQAEAAEVDTRIKPADAFRNLFSKKSYNIERFYSKGFDALLIRILKSESFDIIQLETLFVTPYLETIRKFSKAKIVLRAHNVEYRIWERRAENTSNPALKWYISLLAKRLKAYEVKRLNSYDAIAVITDEDATEFKKESCTIPIITIPFGINVQKLKIDRSIKEEFPSCFHLGAMNWEPNIEGVNWLLNTVWKKNEEPEIKLYLAGRYMPAAFTQLNRKNIFVVGEVKSQFEFMQSKGIMLVPLLSAGGMRIKIIEGMMIGKTIISTSVGAEGIPCEHKKNILIANTPQEFRDCINLCITQPELYKRIGKNAQQLVRERFDSIKISRNLLNFYQELLRR